LRSKNPYAGVHGFNFAMKTIGGALRGIDLSIIAGEGRRTIATPGCEARQHSTTKP
jgi:hypothetical protein